MNIYKSLVDLSGVTLPDATPDQQDVYAQLAPHVGVARPAPDLSNPSAKLLRLAIDRHGVSIIDQDIRGHFRDNSLFVCGGLPFPDNGTTMVRGWYGTREEPRWCPCQSLFGGRGGRHLGVDFAAPPGATVLAPVSGIADYNLLGNEPVRGNHIFIYADSSPPFGCFFCHLYEPLGDFPRRVSAGEAVAALGSTGLSLYCGEANSLGKYDTHLHLEIVTLEGHQDPIHFLGLTPLHGADDRCFFPQEPLKLHLRSGHPLLTARVMGTLCLL